jgi:hypothetical protein
MAIKKKLLYITAASLILFTHCSRDKSEQYLVDMESIQPDGSSNQIYIFRDEIEREKQRSKRYYPDKDKF